MKQRDDNMNETMKVLLERKSVRVFEDKPIAPEIKEDILTAAMRAPTAGNSMFYSILDITDQALKDRLAVTCDSQPFIATAPLVLVFLADNRRWMKKFQQAECENIPTPELSDLILATNDAVIAAHAACVAAESYGIGSCYIGDIVENFEQHRELFGLPEYVAPVSMLVFGYPTEQQKNRKQPPRFQKDMIVFENKYHDLTDSELMQYKDNESTKAYFNRKVVADFSVEMKRSAKVIFKNWQGGD